MEETQRLEIARRIKDLRVRSPYTQPKIAAELNIGLRGYQKLEEKGTTSFERCEEIARIHAGWTKRTPDWTFVDADWIWDGQRRDETPDLMGSLGGGSQLNRIEQVLGELDAKLTRLARTATRQEESLAALLRQRQERADAPKRRAQGGRG